MTKRPAAWSQLLNRAVLTAAGVLGSTLTAHAQRGVRVGIAVSIPIRTHPLSDPEKGTLLGLLMFVGVLVGLAVAACLIYLLYCCVWLTARDRLRERQWQEKELMDFLPPRAARPTDREQVRLMIEQARGRKREWEERAARARRERATSQARESGQTDPASYPGDGLLPL